MALKDLDRNYQRQFRSPPYRQKWWSVLTCFFDFIKYPARDSLTAGNGMLAGRENLSLNLRSILLSKIKLKYGQEVSPCLEGFVICLPVVSPSQL
ncbi:hypothetical protein Pla110_05270 [Polystyrenella longa]|uniref:Uncharacterized protein n=1 Tax=Polystyrenella longa TaxID=2528007 RepID=A0A518CHW5_9PLAN|nr:hypothetical protein Pla110_05270 [Polystyrenella longa]